MIRVLLIEDSAITRHYLSRLLNADPEIEVVGTARRGSDALKLTLELKPDVVTMDIHMPGINGFEATRRIMEECPVPVIICSSSLSDIDSESYIEAGAVAAVITPVGGLGDEANVAASDFIQTVKAMASVKLIRRWTKDKYAASIETDVVDRKFLRKRQTTAANYVVIGASTGGPPVISKILSILPQPFPVPILIVQHISIGFLEGLCSWLGKNTDFPVVIAEEGMEAMPGVAHFAPDTHHMTVDPDGMIRLWDCPAVNHLKPAIAPLFKSMAKNFGNKTVAIMLTGMGRDGAQEMRWIYDAGGVTIAQDRQTSVVHGMPAEAIRLGGVQYIEPPEKIALRICEAVGVKK
ncbi:chemotaxis-specific protein-glutamate methyltransferase CheB [bacterium]|nr:chemotaxis-specific protein-glutamate methyltransferase CheB [bacterium]